MLNKKDSKSIFATTSRKSNAEGNLSEKNKYFLWTGQLFDCGLSASLQPFWWRYRDPTFDSHF